MPRTLFALATVLSFVAIALPSTAVASPTNDNFVSATVIDPGTLPFSDSVDDSSATNEPGEIDYCTSSVHTVWYAITPTSDGLIRADMSGTSLFDPIVRVYRQNGSGLGGLSLVGCASPYWNGQRSLTFNASANVTYYIQAGNVFWWSGGLITLSVQAIPPPANDDFANAAAISSVPFNSDVDLTAATTESGEPTPSCGFPPQNSAWYAFTSPATGSYTLNATSSNFGFVIEYGAYTGSSLANLSQVACHYGNPLTFHADAGATVYLQVASGGGQAGPIHLQLTVAPDPVAAFSYYPFDPSSFDTLQLNDNSYDPAQAGIQSRSWDLGDGTTATGCCIQHRYAGDGDYAVQLTITTVDGRTASTRQVIHVRTHDVAIAKLTVPQSASAGQTRQIVVGISNVRYDETVQVQLFRNTISRRSAR